MLLVSMVKKHYNNFKKWRTKEKDGCLIKNNSITLKIKKL